ncbi:hypothetical protein CSOJ01_15614, partial [Colletotrichum sojae]
MSAGRTMGFREAWPFPGVGHSEDSDMLFASQTWTNFWANADAGKPSYCNQQCRKEQEKGVPSTTVDIFFTRSNNNPPPDIMTTYLEYSTGPMSMPSAFHNSNSNPFKKSNGNYHTPSDTRGYANAFPQTTNPFSSSNINEPRPVINPFST